MGAVSIALATGDRKERFIAEIRLRKLVSGFLREQADPHLDKGVSRLKQIEDLINSSNSRIPIPEEPAGMRFYQLAPANEPVAASGQDDRGKSDRLPQKNKD